MKRAIVTRHATVTGFVAESGRTLLHWHRKTGMWLPPGGHIEPDEDAVQAVLREVREETGITAEIIAEPLLAFEEPAQLPPPRAILVEDIEDGPHQHIDHIYFVRPVSGAPVGTAEEAFIWVTAEQLRRNEPLAVAACGIDLPVTEDVRVLGLAAIAAAG